MFIYEKSNLDADLFKFNDNIMNIFINLEDFFNLM